MIVEHRFTIHAICPFIEGQWDYYDVILNTEDIVEVNELDRLLDGVRGMKAPQEQIAMVLREILPISVRIETVGRHSLTSQTKTFS